MKDIINAYSMYVLQTLVEALFYALFLVSTKEKERSISAKGEGKYRGHTDVAGRSKGLVLLFLISQERETCSLRPWAVWSFHAL